MPKHQTAVLAQIRPGKRVDLKLALRQGPPFDLAEHGFTRHQAFLGDTDVVLIFEGDRAHIDAHRLVASLGIEELTQMAALVAAPRELPESFVWEAASEPVHTT